MQALQTDAGAIAYPAAWAEARARLARVDASVFDTYELLPALYPGDIPDALCYQGTLQAERVEQALHERMAREKDEFRRALARLADAAQGREAAEAANGEPPKFDVTRRDHPGLPNRFTFELSLDGRPIAPPATAATAAPIRRISPKTPTIRKARSSTTSGTTGANTTASTGARCARSTCSR